jgi:hypothetical protein
LVYSFSLLLPACGGAADGSNNAAGGADSAGAVGLGGSPGHAAGDSSGGASAGAGATTSAGLGGGATSSSKLPEASVLGQLSTSELTELCTETYTGPLFTAAHSGACLDNALLAAAASGPNSDADARLACHAFYDSCVKRMNNPGGACPTIDQSCQATVGEYFKCVDDVAAGYAAAYARFPSCDAITVALLMTTSLDEPPPPPEPASCVLVDNKCQDIVGAP